MNPRPHSTGQMGEGVGERFADVRVADRMARGRGGVTGRRMLWTMNTGVFY